MQKIDEAVQKFKFFAQLAVQHFEAIYKEPLGTNITEIVKVVFYFPQIISKKEMNKFLNKSSRRSYC